MHVNLSSEMENYIKDKVASGYYRNSTEVIRDAIRRMKAEEDRRTAWEAAIKQSDGKSDRYETPSHARINGVQDSTGSSMPCD